MTHTSADLWNDRLDALEFARSRFEKWAETSNNLPWKPAAVQEALGARRKAWEQARDHGQQPTVDPPLEQGRVGETIMEKELRQVIFMQKLLRNLEQEEVLPLPASHAMHSWVRARRSALEASVIPDVIPAEEAVTARKPKPRPDGGKNLRDLLPKRPIMEILLDPRNIQWLFVLGAGLLVIGLIIYLATLGLFEQPITIAILLGVANLGALVGGWALIAKTRFQTAGRALTLLACLVMPLNLWFYHAQGLLTLDQHLWVAALVICALYAASSMVLRDPLFVYTLTGGIALTGCLMLIDAGRFWELTAPCVMLTIMGLVCIHAERAFPPGDGPFSRKRFGLAFFWSGHLILLAGLVLLLGGQIAGNWFEPVFRDLYYQYQSEPIWMVRDAQGQILALCLVLAAVYAYLYSDFVVRGIGLYLNMAVVTLIWAEVLAVELLKLQLGMDAVIAVLAATGLAVHLLTAQLRREHRMERALTFLSVGLALAPVLLGIGVLARWMGEVGFNRLGLFADAPGPLQWSFVGAMALAAFNSRFGAYLAQKTSPGLAAVLLGNTAAAILVGASGLLGVLGFDTWGGQAPLLMIVPLLYMVAVRAYRGTELEVPVAWVAHLATAAMLVLSLFPTFRGFVLVEGHELNLQLAVFFAEAAVFYVLASVFRGQGFNVYFATAAGCAALWQLFSYLTLEPDYYTPAFAVLGLALLLGYRFALTTASNQAMRAAFQSANVLLLVAFAAGALRALAGLAGDTNTTATAVVLVILTLISLVAAGLVAEPNWRRVYIVLAVVEGALALIVTLANLDLLLWQKAELVSVLLGVLLLVVGHVGWYREQRGSHHEIVGLCLFVGSLLVVVPVTLAVLGYRYDSRFVLLQEMTLLGSAIILLSVGFMCRIQATTLLGAVGLAVYLVTLVLFVRVPDVLKTTGAVLALVGAGLFGGAILLSIYRDRLLTLPERVRRREGLFRVLTWR